MVLAANAPDFDVVSLLAGPLTYLHWHRYITHSLIAAPLMALLSVALVRFAGQQRLNWLRAWMIALVAVASHLLLDLTNIYGIRLLLPFSGRWFHLDLTPVIDFTIWAILLVGIAAPALTRLVNSEIGERNRTAGNGGWAFTALLLFSVYDYGRSMLHDRAVSMVDAHTYNGLAPRQSAAFPDQNPLTWTGLAELSNAWVQGPVDLRGELRVDDFETFSKGGSTPAIEEAIKTPAFQAMLQFVQYPLWVTAPGQVALYDLRFGNPREPGFYAHATLSESNRVTGAEMTMAGPRIR